jgi:single-strand DNA-binding protein
MSKPVATVTGNLTADPEIRFFDGGSAKASFSIAVNSQWKDASGQMQERTSYFDVVAWKALAEDIVRVATKGSRVIVTGTLEQRSWDDKASGQKRTKVEIVADEVAVSVRSIEEFTRKQRVEGSDGATKKPARGRGPAVNRQDIPEDEEPF